MESDDPNGAQPDAPATIPPTTNPPSTNLPADEAVPPVLTPAPPIAPTTPPTSDPVTLPDTSADEQEPPSLTTLPVTFEITVPVYQSNQLSVDLVWGEIRLTAMWVGDEYWSATGEFPIATSDDLVVSFYDRNGDIELARATQEFTVGSNVIETVKVLADQFDANQFDTDGDGINNLDELRAGTDPLVDEQSLLEVRDAFILSEGDYHVYLGYVLYSWGLDPWGLDAVVSEQRPQVESRSEFIPFSEDVTAVGTTLTTEVDIDANGSGRVSISSDARWLTVTSTGTRTSNDDSIAWDGEFSWYDNDYFRSVDFSNEVLVINENMREFTHSVNEVYRGTFRDAWVTSGSLTGEVIEGTSFCKPVSGTITRAHQTNRNGFPATTVTTTVSKDADNQNWKIVSNSDGSDDVAIEYLARELMFQPNDSEPDDLDLATFRCDFVDFQQP